MIKLDDVIVSYCKFSMRHDMRISYKKLWIMLAEQEMSKQDFREELKIASGTMTKLNKGQEVSMAVILRICDFFDCNIGDICDAVKIE